MNSDDLTDDELLESGSKLGSRDWRLSNLYKIKDENGHIIKFVPNEVQRSLDKDMWYRNIIPKARKLGCSTFISIFILDECFINSGTVAGITDKTLTDAEDKLAIIRLAYQSMPEEVRETYFRLVRDNDKYMEWSNGSNVSVGLTYRGSTPRLLHISEYGKVAVDTPDLAREIKTGAIQAVPQTGFVFVESTAHGTSGDFCDMVRAAENKRISKQLLTPLDFRSLFFGWHLKQEYRLPSNMVIVPQELREYFEELRVKHGVALDADQMAWYAKKHEELGPDDIMSEFPSVPTELFYSSLQGSYWRRELNRARAEGRIGGMVPHDPTRRVNTFWDIGEDCTAIWFHQTDGVRHRFIDYYEEEGGSLQTAAGVLDDKKRARSFIYEKHYGPHDLEHRDWANTAQTRVKTAKDLGIEFTIVPRVNHKDESIEAARRMINMAWFDAVHCARGVDVIENYRKKWNERTGVFMAEPIHDFSSHGSDALQQGAMGLKPEKLKNREGRYGLDDKSRTTSWAQ